MAGFMAFLGEVGAERDNNQQAKTHWALDHYAGALRSKAAARARPRSKAAPKKARRTANPGRKPKR
jgi:hypothetical protein